MSRPFHHHISHPYVVVSALVGTLSVAILAVAFPVSAVTLKSYKHATHGYQFQYPVTWSTKASSLIVSVKPPTKTVTYWSRRGVNYALTTTWLNNDTATFTPALKRSLSGGWSKFVTAYGAVLGKRYGAKATFSTVKKTGWQTSVMTFKRRVNGVPTTWRVIALSKDRKQVFVVTEKWTRNWSSPFAADAATLVKTLTTYTPPDTCGNAVGNGSTIIAGPSAPTAPQGGADYDQIFHSLSVHPTDPNKVYTGTERNGVLYSADGGQTWTRYRSGIRHIGTAGYTELWNMDISPSDPTRILLAGNDSPGPLAGDYPSNTGGIYLSTDSGQTWSRKNCGLTNGQTSSVVFDPTNANIAYVGGRGGYPSFAQPGDSVYKLYPSGIYRTTDAGTKWTKVTLPGPGNADTSDFWQMVARGTNPTTYISFGLNLNDTSQNVGFVKSTDGVTWTAMAPEFRTKKITEFDVSADGQVIIGSVRDSAEVIISTDGGATWASQAVNFSGALAISPADSSRVVHSAHSDLRISTDRLATSTVTANPGAKVSDIVFAPSDPNIVYAIAGGYLFYKSTDAGATFTLLKNLRSDVINVIP